MTALAGSRSMPATSAVTPVVRAVNTGSWSTPALNAWGSVPSVTGLLISQATAMTVAAVAACVRVRAQAMARCTPSLVLENDVTTKVDHPIAKLLRRPNRWQTWFEFMEMIGAAYVLRGNAYIVRLRDVYDDTVEMIPVNPDLVQVLESPDGSLFYQVARNGLWLMAVLQNMPIAIPEFDVIHIRDLSFNALIGAGRMGLSREAIGLAMAQEQQSARWAGNGARPGGVLQSDKKITDDVLARLKSSWASLREGIQNAGSTAILEDGVKWQAMQLTSVDLEFLNSRKFQAEEICRHYDTPPHKIGIMSNLGRSTIAELNADFVNGVVMSDVERVEQKFEQAFGLDELGYSIHFDNRRLIRADLQTQMMVARAGVQGPILSQNEGRDLIGLPPKTGKETGPDAVNVPLNLDQGGSGAGGSDQTGAAPDGAGRPKPIDSPNPDEADLKS